MSHRRADSTRRKNMSRLQLEPLERREVLSSLPVPAPLPVPASLTSQYQLVATIRLPGNPLTSFDISYVDSTTHRLYFADRSNAGVDIIDTRTNTFLGRVGGFVGLPPGGKEVGGPNGVVAVGNNEVWASDGDSTIKVIKLNADRTGGKVVQTISTGGKDRVDEVAYDPRDHLVAAVNNNDSPPFVSLISTNHNNRHIVAQLSITSATGGLEQPLWDPGLGKFLVSVPELNHDPSYNAIAEIDPRTFTVTYLPLNGLQPSGLVLGPNQELLVSNNDGGIAAGLPARSEIISALTVTSSPPSRRWPAPTRSGTTPAITTITRPRWPSPAAGSSASSTPRRTPGFRTSPLPPGRNRSQPTPATTRSSSRCRRAQRPARRHRRVPSRPSRVIR